MLRQIYVTVGRVNFQLVQSPMQQRSSGDTSSCVYQSHTVLQVSTKALSILFTTFDTSRKTMEVFRRFTYDFGFLSESSRDFLEMMTRC